jgi:hypothetical protein
MLLQRFSQLPVFLAGHDFRQKVPGSSKGYRQLPRFGTLPAAWIV